METKKTALSFAAAGTVAGVAGLVLLASPAGAGEAPPSLPAISPDDLVESVLNTEIPALSGSVAMENNLGLPIPGMPGSTDGSEIRVYTDGEGKHRLQMPRQGTETTVIDDGTTVWVWNSAERTVTKTPHKADGKQAEKPLEGRFADPATAARDLVDAMQADSTVDVDGTARVAERPVYQLVLTPKPTERTLLREVRVSVDSETRVPLQVEVLANGQAEPAIKAGFTEFADGPQDPGLFQFTPPKGATVTEQDPKEEFRGQSPEDMFGELDLNTYGEGWDTVLTGTVPEAVLTGDFGDFGSDRDRGGDQGDRGDFGEGMGNNPLDLLGTLGKQVSGDFGTGYVISANVGTALITEDGKIAIGAVPEQVVIEAVEQMK
ncbi:MAG TPA: outer membrane lipoprotein carrier protein LolA [Actinophytocola sp.]|nr:outer membrane lipoprotein carrier protein LolA [Actinophytocola sp.]